MCWGDTLGGHTLLFCREDSLLIAAVLVAIAINTLVGVLAPPLALSSDLGQLATIPKLTGLSDFLSNGPENILGWLSKSKLWSCALIIALIASVETLLCL